MHGSDTTIQHYHLPKIVGMSFAPSVSQIKVQFMTVQINGCHGTVPLGIASLSANITL